MSLPAGFKVNGAKVEGTGIPVPPSVKKTIALLERLPDEEVLTTLEMCGRLGLTVSGGLMTHPALANHRCKVDRIVFWGSRASIAKLRTHLESSEETVSDQN